MTPTDDVGLTDRDLDPYEDDPPARTCAGDCDSCRKPIWEACPDE